MKRRISLVIALFVSFLLMFSPIARAEETTFNTVTTSKPVELEVVKIPQDTNKADSPPQIKVKEPISIKRCVICPDGHPGRWSKIAGVDTCLSSCI